MIKRDKAEAMADQNETTTEKSDVTNDETVNRAAFQNSSEFPQLDSTDIVEAPKNLTVQAPSSTGSY